MNNDEAEFFQGCGSVSATAATEVRIYTNLIDWLLYTLCPINLWHLVFDYKLSPFLLIFF